MDIINPPIEIIGNSFYRVNPIIEDDKIEKPNYKQMNLGEIDDTFEPECDYDESEMFDIQVENDMYVCYLDVPPMFYPFLIGKRGESRKKIELDTKTGINIPKQNECGKVVVSGNTYEGVERALSRILLSIDYGREVSEFTHFYSIPTNSADIRSNFFKFSSEVLKFCVGDRGITAECFQKPEKLHLTLSMLVLGNKYEIERAVHVFKQFKKERYDLFDEPIMIRIKGLDYMNDDPCLVRILYGKVDESLDYHRLQEIGNTLNSYLLKERLYSKKESEDLKLHMTLMRANFINNVTNEELGDNTTTSVIGDESSHSLTGKSMDCSNILKKFKDWEFGVLTIDEIHLSRRFNVKQDCYYESVAVIQLNE